MRTRCPAHAMHGLTTQTSVDACYCEQGFLWDSATKTCAMCPAGSFNNRANESQRFECVQAVVPSGNLARKCGTNNDVQCAAFTM